MNERVECLKCKAKFEQSRMSVIFDAKKEEFLSSTPSLLINSNEHSAFYEDLEFNSEHGNHETEIREQHPWIQPLDCKTFFCDFCVDAMIRDDQIVREARSGEYYYPTTCDKCDQNFPADQQQDKYGTTLFSRKGKGCDVIVFDGPVFEDRREIIDGCAMHYKLRGVDSASVENLKRICNDCFDQFVFINGVEYSELLRIDSMLPENIFWTHFFGMVQSLHKTK